MFNRQKTDDHSATTINFLVRNITLKPFCATKRAKKKITNIVFYDNFQTEPVDRKKKDELTIS